ncbi:unnamed protein product, partial [Phaeothamnion confervicola]
IDAAELVAGLSEAREAALASLSAETATTSAAAAQALLRLTDDRLRGLCRLFDGDGDGRIDYREFSRRLVVSGQRQRRFLATTTASSSVSTAAVTVDLRREAARLGLIVPATRVLLGHERAVTALAYLPVSMLLASAAADGRVRLWDPCAANHRLVHPGTAGHVRRWPGHYIRPLDRWTTAGAPFGCVLQLDVAAAAAAAAFGANSGAGAGGVYAAPTAAIAAAKRGRILIGGSGSAAAAAAVVTAMEAVVSEAHPTSGRILCPEEDERLAATLDAGSAAAYHGAGIGGGGRDRSGCRGFLYLMDDGDLLAVSSEAFHRRYVLLADAGFFEVSGAVRRPPTEAMALRAAFRQRARVLRVLYAVSTAHHTLRALCRAVRAVNAAVQASGALNGFPGARFVVFYRVGDGPSSDVSDRIFQIAGGHGRSGQPSAAAGLSLRPAGAGIVGIVSRVHPNGTVEVVWDGATRATTIGAETIAPLLGGGSVAQALPPTSIAGKAGTGAVAAHNARLTTGMRIRMRSAGRSGFVAAGHNSSKSGSFARSCPTSGRVSGGGTDSDGLGSAKVAGDASEVLCIETRDMAGGRQLSCWAIGRVALRVEARHFDDSIDTA